MAVLSTTPKGDALGLPALTSEGTVKKFAEQDFMVFRDLLPPYVKRVAVKYYGDAFGRCKATDDGTVCTTFPPHPTTPLLCRSAILSLRHSDPPPLSVLPPSLSLLPSVSHPHTHLSFPQDTICTKAPRDIFPENGGGGHVHSISSDRFGYFLNEYMKPLVEFVAGRKLQVSYSYFVQYRGKPGNPGLMPHIDMVDNEYV
jgi:hypothetical protein